MLHRNTPCFGHTPVAPPTAIAAPALAMRVPCAPSNRAAAHPALPCLPSLPGRCAPAASRRNTPAVRDGGLPFAAHPLCLPAIWRLEPMPYEASSQGPPLRLLWYCRSSLAWTFPASVSIGTHAGKLRGDGMSPPFLPFQLPRLPPPRLTGCATTAPHGPQRPPALAGGRRHPLPPP